MSKPTVRAGIFGSRFAAAFHYAALQRVYSASVEVAGVYSPSREHRERFAADRGLLPFETPERLLEECDVVHLCTPPSTHRELTAAVLEAGSSVVIEKPFTGYFGDGSDRFNGDTFDREHALEVAVEESGAIIAAEAEAQRKASGVGEVMPKPQVFYAENWVYAPAIQKEREIIEKTGSQLLWILANQSHSGSHSEYYGQWRYSGGGSIMGKGVHPISAVLYLKKVEGRSRTGEPIRPVAVSARTHAVTRDSRFRDEGFLRTSYTDIEDFGALHLIFEDGTFADIFAGELSLGGVTNRLEVYANNHRTNCNMNPNSAMETFNPRGEQFEDIYVVEKIGTREGWAPTSPDEAWFTGYQHEMEAFYRSAVSGRPAESDSRLGAETIAVVYAAYLSAARKGTEVEIPRV